MPQTSTAAGPEKCCVFFIGGSKDRRATAAPGGCVALGPGNVWPRPLQLFGFVIGGLTDHDTFAPGGRVTQRPMMFSADLGIDLPRGGVGSWKVEKPFDQCVWGARNPWAP